MLNISGNLEFQLQYCDYFSIGEGQNIMLYKTTKPQLYPESCTASKDAVDRLASGRTSISLLWRHRQERIKKANLFSHLNCGETQVQTGENHGSFSTSSDFSPSHLQMTSVLAREIQQARGDIKGDNVVFYPEEGYIKTYSSDQTKSYLNLRLCFQLTL